ncbi:Hint domain-containing protein [Defluviimonas aestuarii]|uniref:Hint domain-containing protein n=1 Tax=Albidovulum aestuarii TaxID=1130726 RepID=UPI00249CE3F7|nr:Hint domain-containing protein [Defluviimonas aestuarii]MDI3336103.1 Hint domain-containing protein [Defluviimonas aestuarii]
MKTAYESMNSATERPLPPGRGALIPESPRPSRRIATPVIWTLPGLIGTARVETSFGALPVQALRKHDPLRTVQGSYVRVSCVVANHLDADFLSANPDAQPIRIMAGSLGPNCPKTDLLVSPAQKINVSPGQFRQDFRMARELLDKPGVMRAPQALVSYYSFQCTAPAAVLVEGLCVSADA